MRILVKVPESDPAIVGTIVPVKAYEYETRITRINASDPEDVVIILERGYNVNTHYTNEIGVEDLYYENGVLIADEYRDY